jgi:tyrosine decarboxylase / aspartate 1-decarboxylase
MLMHQKLCADARWVSPFAPELDILVWAVRGDTVATSSRLAQQIFAAAAGENLHLALAQLPSRFFLPGSWSDQNQHGSITCLRSVLMKPEHLEWLPDIWKRLNQVTNQVLAQPPAEDMAATGPR